MSKKGQKIWSLYIDRGIVNAFTKDNKSVSLTRSQRQVLSNYTNKNYIENVCKAFSNKECLHEEFSIMKDGVLVYKLKNHLT